MGAAASCACTATYTKETKAIDHELRKERRKQATACKILVLGAEGSGKSTVIKQIRLSHGIVFSDVELDTFKNVIRMNILTGLKHLVKQARNLKVKIARRKKEYLDVIMTASIYTDDADKLLQACAEIWKEPTVQRVYKEAPKGLLELYYLEYWMENVLEKLYDNTWKPSNEDVIYARQRTTGIAETKLEYNGNGLTLVDVGGQRNERRKWIHCFADSEAIIYMVALDEWDVPSREDAQKTKFEISEGIWRDVVMSPALASVGCFVIFLNKVDLFRVKIALKDMQETFPDYRGGHDVNEGIRYIQERYLAVKPEKQQKIYSHITCAIDRDLVQKTFAIVVDAVIKDTLALNGLL